LQKNPYNRPICGIAANIPSDLTSRSEGEFYAGAHLRPDPVPADVGLTRPFEPGRLESIDILRGVVMIVMALDHTRDFFTHLRFAPEDLARTWYALFFTRWVTHFCAPLFFFLAGTGAFFYGRRRSPAQLSRFLWTRGLWLIVLEFTVIATAWTFHFPFGLVSVIWTLGACMVLMAAIVRLPLRWLAVLSWGMIATHNLLDGIGTDRFGSLAWLWQLLHVQGVMFESSYFTVLAGYQIIPWVGVMGAGYAFGRLYLLEPERRSRLMVRLGLALTLLFVFLRLTNLYGNPPAGSGVSQGDWHVQPTVEKTLILFLDVEKYPPSLQFLLMTLGPSLLLLAWLDKRMAGRGGVSGAMSVLLIFGRVPLFYYILHLYLIHTMAVLVAAMFHQPAYWLLHGAVVMYRVPEGYGHNLPFIYLMWILTVVIAYFPCRWWAGLKQRRKDWWLSYV
jgi:uncharacterized membrane protein